MGVQQVPTAEEVAAWPAPNYINPDTRGSMVLGIEIPFAILTVLIVTARMIAPMFTRRSLGAEDWLMAFVTVLSTSVSIINCVSINFGFGYHFWDFRLDKWTSPVAKVALIEQVFFFPTVLLTKISILLFYLRIFPSQLFHKLTWGGIVFLSLFTVAAFFAVLFQCTPVSSYWNPFDPTRKCVDEKVFLLAAAAINIICDVFVFVLPLPWLAKLQMPRKQRYGVIVLFGLGLIVCVAGTLRIWYITVYFGSYDIFYNGAVLSALAVVECDVGIICGSLPTIRQLVAQVFPKVLDTSKDNTSHVPGSQSFPFQNLERKNEVHTSIVGGQQDNTSEESILRAGIGRRDDIEVRYSTYT